MSKPETTFTDSIHKYLPPGRKAPYFMKNNNIYTAGIWDCWYSGSRCDLWVEYKFEVLPKRADTIVPITLSPLQVQWGERRVAEGRSMVVIVGCKEGGVIFTDEDWLRPLTREEFVDRLMTRKEIADWLIAYTEG